MKTGFAEKVMRDVVTLGNLGNEIVVGNKAAGQFQGYTCQFSMT
jgi:hypothetical protein